MSLKQLSTNIRTLRLRKGLTQFQVSKFVGISSSSCGHWENGRIVPNTDQLVILTKLFECSIDDLVRKNMKLISGTTKVKIWMLDPVRSMQEIYI